MRKVCVLFLTERFILSTCDQRQYHFVSGSFTWSEAQAYCRQKHTDLATIQSPTEMNQVLDTLSSAGHTSEVWIGLYSEIDWRWSDGFTGNGAEYRDWETSDHEPDFYYAYQFCVTIAENGKCWDDSCSISYPFICYNGNEIQLLLHLRTNKDFIIKRTNAARFHSLLQAHRRILNMFWSMNPDSGLMLRRTAGRTSETWLPSGTTRKTRELGVWCLVGP